MSHLDPRNASEVPELAPFFAASEAAMGFVPNSMLTMAHLPQLPAAFLFLASTVFGADLKTMAAAMQAHIPAQSQADENLAPELIQLIALASSVASGCRYCQAHTSHRAHDSGAATEKLEAILDYADSELYSDAERAALDLAFAAGRVPNEAEPAHFERLQQHFSKRQVTQIVAVIALFGFLNRWNDTLATTLESTPAEFAASALTALGWSQGKHG